ncbi:O-antigen ligase family protein [Thermosulfurimonas dismutans]|uniref:O-antigen ligase-related domain-containing protein n=1 Tax=Thermosulfurimonas dismutans TaxID=999894 RepID=A0A179D1A9_9BACT|nr:O-antigen ligase family protein [Thermosulfurimonas dismutans]OAQ19844.1 hypothetical protein TDIS_2062 [Thermosulfurimonas dismutans]
MLSKIAVVISSLILILLSFYPLAFIRFYIVIRTLFQPFANKHLTLFGNFPINAPLPLILLFYSYLACIFRQDFSLFVPNSVYLYLFLFWSLLSLINSFNLYASFAFIFKILAVISVYLLIYNSIESAEDFKKIHKTVVFLALITIFYGFCQIFLKEGQPFYGPIVRIKSFFSSANEFGIFLSLAIISNLILVAIEGFKKQYKIFLSLMILAYILALNRGSWIAMTTSIFLSYFFFRDKIRLRSIVLPIAIIFLMFSPIIILRFLQLENPAENTFVGRINFWKNMLYLIPQHPLLGFGIGTTELVFQSLTGRKIYPHNDFLRLFFEMGFGSIFYILFLIKSLLFFIKNKANNWKTNFLFIVSLFYWLIISIPQNIVNNVVLFPLFMTLIASGLKYNFLINFEGKHI